MSLPIAVIIPLVAQFLTLSLKIADIIDRSGDVSVEDKLAMKEAIKTASDNVTYWNKEGT
jgi:hypothetical protein